MATFFKDSLGILLSQTYVFDQTFVLTGSKVELLILKPDASEVSWTATVDTASTSHYTTVANDLDQEGKYVYNVKITYPSTGTPTKIFFSPAQTFDVIAQYEAAS